MPTIAIVGASSDRRKFGNKALRSFRAQGYTVVPIHPTETEVEGERAYARVLKQRYVYTPEMVVDGIGHDTGRDRAPIEALLAKAQAPSPRSFRFPLPAFRFPLSAFRSTLN